MRTGGGQVNRSQTPCPTRGSRGALSARNQRKALTLKSLGHHVSCLLFSFLVEGILMTPECESLHVGDNVGTHEHCTPKGPALNHQDAEWGLQIRLLWQILGEERAPVSLKTWGGGRGPSKDRWKTIHLNLHSQPRSITNSLCHP